MRITRQQVKNAMLPLAMIGGAVFYKWMGYFTFLSPYLIFMMLFITYCRLNVKDIKPGKFEIGLLVVQLVLSAIVYFALAPWNHVVAEGVFMCVFIPTATAAPVITAMLGGSISKVATYSLLCNVFVAIVGPMVLAAVGDHPEITFVESSLLICKRVFPLLILPLFLAFMLKFTFPKLHDKISNQQQLSFYIWAVSLFIVLGSSISFAINHWEHDRVGEILALIFGALIVCLGQFKIGRLFGARFKDKVSGGQSLGQKNTVLAVWLALTYMNPIASIAPSAYIAWQNIVNSWQLVRHTSGHPRNE